MVNLFILLGDFKNIFSWLRMKGKSLINLAMFMAFGLVIFILYLYFFVGFGELMEVFNQVNPYEYFTYYSLTIIVMIVSMLFYSMSWNELLKILSIKVGLKNAFLYCWLGNFVDLILPLETISGEITRIFLIHRETGDSSGKIVATVIGHRIITTFMTLSGLLLATMLFLLRYKGNSEVLYLLFAVLSGSLFLIGAMLYLSLREKAAEKLIDFPLKAVSFLTRDRLNLSEIKEKIRRNLLHFHESFKTFGRRPRALTKSILYSFIAWFFHLSIYFLVFYALGFSEISAKIYETIIVYSISVAVQTVPIALPLGLVEIVMTSLYALFNIPAAIGGAATLLIRVVTFWLQILVGYAMAQWIGVKKLLAQVHKKH